MTTPKLVYAFSEGNKDQKDLLGGKGANLAEMTKLGLPVPPGFTITTEACREYLRTGTNPPDLLSQISSAVDELEKQMGRSLGDVSNPLLLSVRSGAKFSMPGMMETVLNIGLNDESVNGLAEVSGNPRFAWDSYRRLIQMYGKTVLEIDGSLFAEALADAELRSGVQSDVEIPAEHLQNLVEKYKQIYAQHGYEFPQAPKTQLMGAVEAVFRSWNTPRAQLYRRQERIPSDLGTAVNVQAMVFGNSGEHSGTGVAFTRDPATAASTATTWRARRARTSCQASGTRSR